MAQLPTAICHLFDPDEHPLVNCVVTNTTDSIRRVRVTSRIENYSAPAVDTAELKKNKPETFKQLPTLFPERAARVRELMRATLNVLVEDLDTGKVEIQRTRPIWLLALTTAPLAVRDPVTGGWRDLTRYFGAFVTPNAPELMTFLRAPAALPFALRGRLPDERGDYTVRVLVDLDGDGLVSRGDFVNVESYPVLTRGHPREVTVKVERVG